MLRQFTRLLTVQHCSTKTERRSSLKHYTAALGGLGACLLTQSGCGSLPNSGPTESEVYEAQKDPKKNTLGFGIVQISADLLTLIASEQPTPLSTLETVTSRDLHNDRVGPGDTLQVSIYELGNSLFSGGGANASGASTMEAMAGSQTMGGASSTNVMLGNSTPDPKGSSAALGTNLPPIVVSGQGTITVPYVGTIPVAGKTVEQIASDVRVGLSKKSQAPQVIVRMVQGVTNAAMVYGDVKHPGRVLLTPSRECLLDIIAIAQGTTHPPEDSIIQLTRGGHVVRVPMTVPENNPSQDIQIQPGDRIEVIFKPRTYTVFGAALKVTEVPFQVPELTLSEALARSGGPIDSRGDPNGVFLLRFEDNNIVRRLGFPVAEGSPVTPVVYQIDMMNPGSYFLAQRFFMKDKDVIYFSNAKANEFYKLFGLISTIIQPGITAGYMAR